MTPEVVVGSAHSPPAVWNVSRHRPTFARSTFCAIPQTSLQSGACVAQHQFSYASRKPCAAKRSASSRRSPARVSQDPAISGESEEPTYSESPSATGAKTSGHADLDLQHIAPHSLHDLDPSLCPTKGILPLVRLRFPAFEIRERLQHDNLQFSLRNHLLYLFGGFT